MSLSEFNKLFERKDCVTNLTSTPNNIMDYDISWVNRFTPNQQERIRYVLMHSPLVPGPKVERTTTRTLSGEQELPMRMINIIEKEVNRLALHLFFYYKYLVQRLLRLRRRKP